MLGGKARHCFNGGGASDRSGSFMIGPEALSHGICEHAMSQLTTRASSSKHRVLDRRSYVRVLQCRLDLPAGVLLQRGHSVGEVGQEFARVLAGLSNRLGPVVAQVG